MSWYQPVTQQAWCLCCLLCQLMTPRAGGRTRQDRRAASHVCQCPCLRCLLMSPHVVTGGLPVQGAREGGRTGAGGACAANK